MSDQPLSESENQKYQRLERGCLIAIIGLILVVLGIVACVVIPLLDD